MVELVETTNKTQRLVWKFRAGLSHFNRKLSDSSFFDYYVQFFTGKPLPSLPAPNHSAKKQLNEAYDKLSFHDKTILVKIADAMSK